MKVVKRIALDKNFKIISFDNEERIEALLIFEVESENPTREEFLNKYNEIISLGIKPENIKIMKNYYKN